MYRRPSKKQLLIRRIIVLVITCLSVLVIVTGTILFILGYRLDGGNGRLSQGALVQFDSVPNGADVFIDGASVGTQTPTKRSLIAGTHAFMMQKAGYNDWTRSLQLDAGTLTWLDYTRLVPKVLDKQTVSSYSQVAGVSVAPDNETVIVQEKAEVPAFEVVDIRAKDVKIRDVTLPTSLYSESSATGVSHQFTLHDWDRDGRYVLVQHTYNNSFEWIVFDTENTNASVNVTRLLSIGLTDVQFSGTSGNILYGLSEGVIRKLDLSNATISRGLVNGVASFELYDTNIVTYVGLDPNDTNKQVAGLYREGDQAPHILRTAPSDATLNIDTTRYHSDDYIAISEYNEVTILKGRYPSSTQQGDNTMETVETFSTTGAITRFEFSPGGNYLLAQAGLNFQSYEVEYDRLNSAAISEATEAAQPLRWLSDAQLWVSYGGHMSMRDFDGSNAHVLMPVHEDFPVTLSQNGRFLYGVNNTDGTYRLERVTMILE